MLCFPQIFFHSFFFPGGGGKSIMYRPGVTRPAVTNKSGPSGLENLEYLKIGGNFFFSNLNFLLRDDEYYQSLIVICR